MTDSVDTRRVVSAFLSHVRSGRSPERASDFMARRVLAHQVRSEDPATVERTPEDYIEHVQEMRDVWGDFELEVEEFLVEGSRALVRFTQVGLHVGTVEGYAPTGRVVRQTNSVVYNVEAGRITEYWMQIDRAGMLAQLERGARESAEQSG